MPDCLLALKAFFSANGRRTSCLEGASARPADAATLSLRNWLIFLTAGAGQTLLPAMLKKKHKNAAGARAGRRAAGGAGGGAAGAAGGRGGGETRGRRW